MLRFVLVVLVLVGGSHGAQIVEIAPNPIADGDRGEYVVLEFPEETDLSGWSLTDGETTVAFPSETVAGRVVATTDPGAVRNATEAPVVVLAGHLALANDGDSIRLLAGNETVDEARYGRAPEGERYVLTDDGWEWRRPGATDFPVAVERDVEARLFVLPDAPTEATAAIEAARERVWLAAYTFGSRRVTDALCGARGRDVDVRVLVERDPVGGLVRRSADLLDDLVACGVDVTVLGGEGSRFAYHHAKYAVIDDRAIVLTENWNPAGTGGRSSRGWGVLVEGDTVARALVATYDADAGSRDAGEWVSDREDRVFVESEAPPDGRYPAEFEPRRARLDRVEVVVAPDNAEDRIVEAIDAADDSILVKQLSIGSRGQPFVRALVRAAERGVRVRVLLSDAWYVREENAAFASWVNGPASSGDHPIEARLADPRSRFEKVHAKGVVVDEEVVILGSVNWNNASVRENREVAVILHGEGAGEYYGAVFLADWRGGAWHLPIGLAAASGVAAVASAARGRRIRFDGQ